MSIGINPSFYTFQSAAPVVVGTTPNTPVPIPVLPESVANDLTLQTLRQAFATSTDQVGTYDVTVSSDAAISGTNIFQTITIGFTPSDVQTVTVDLIYYFANNITTLASSNVNAFTTGDLSGADNDNTYFYSQNSDDSVSIDRYLDVYFPLSNTTYTFFFKGLVSNATNPAEVTVQSIVVEQQYGITISIIQVLGLLSIYNGPTWNINAPQIEITATTEPYLGANLSEVVYQVVEVYTKCKPCGAQSSKTVFLENSNYPKLNEVLQGTGSLMQRVQQISSTITPYISQFDFLRNIVAYAMLRYYLWKLITGCFDLTILYSNNTAKFFKELACSKYRDFLQVFNETQIKGYSVYFIKGPKC